MKISKTNAIRILDQKKIPYEMLTYEVKDGAIDGISVANKIGHSIENVYKTLVTQGNRKNFFVFVIPVDCTLDLKQAAKAVGEKRVEMLPVKEITKHTGYVRGGCSPIGMKKLYQTVIQADAEALSYIIVSGGKIGLQIKMIPNDLLQLTEAKYAQVIQEE
ncbi:MAG TPA: Cys-tRNA(Pro) deacylase [Firmicutes bacterium]|nr:Cys-tRNA(Pro) deacylase [Bacillota bacterium]